ncbi:hypothetical protein DFH06DRAFT_1232403 [Mycena polygramma]|nr:hypothetical protein DFH06DRAFT_1232403 [Mycena polygramma]
MDLCRHLLSSFLPFSIAGLFVEGWNGLNLPEPPQQPAKWEVDIANLKRRIRSSVRILTQARVPNNDPLLAYDACCGPVCSPPSPNAASSIPRLVVLGRLLSSSIWIQFSVPLLPEKRLRA